MLCLGLIAIMAVRCLSGDGQAVEARAAGCKRARSPNRRPGPRLARGGEPRIVRGPMEIRRGYQVTLGPWTWQFSAPESLDLFDIADRVRSVFGMLAILGVAVFLSDNRRAISGRVVFWGLVLQWAFALMALRMPAGIKVLKQAGDGVNSILARHSTAPGSSSASRWSATRGPVGLRLRLQRPADGHLRRGAVRRPLSPGHHAVGRARLRDRDGQADGHERRRIAQRGRLAVPRPDRGAARRSARSCPG